MDPNCLLLFLNCNTTQKQPHKCCSGKESAKIGLKKPTVLNVSNDQAQKGGNELVKDWRDNLGSSSALLAPILLYVVEIHLWLDIITIVNVF
jgi:hypothetical protein